MQCPKCLELKLPRAGAAFCSKDCFAAAWPEHKKAHKAAAPAAPPRDRAEGYPAGWLFCLDRGNRRALAMPNFGWTGLLRPFPISPRRPVPVRLRLR